MWLLHAHLHEYSSLVWQKKVQRKLAACCSWAVFKLLARASITRCHIALRRSVIDKLRSSRKSLLTDSTMLFIKWPCRVPRKWALAYIFAGIMWRYKVAAGLQTTILSIQCSKAVSNRALAALQRSVIKPSLALYVSLRLPSICLQQ